LISLVNIVFLMLIFFMIMGRVTAPDAIRVDPPESRNATAADAGTIVVLVGSDGRIAVDEKRIEPAELAAVLSRQMERTGIGEASITLKADAETRADRLDEVLDVMRSLGVDRLSLAADVSR
jgi:biopolymer transport protein ExbD